MQWIVSGAHSAEVPITGTRHWIEELRLNLGLPTIRPWGAWKYN